MARPSIKNAFLRGSSQVDLHVWCMWYIYTCLACRDERHPRPGTKRPRDDEDEEEDLNESNYDEVSGSFSPLQG